MRACLSRGAPFFLSAVAAAWEPPDRETTTRVTRYHYYRYYYHHQHNHHHHHHHCRHHYAYTLYAHCVDIGALASEATDCMLWRRKSNIGCIQQK